MAEASRRISLSPGDALIVVPPFAGLDRPSLAAHTLQACARAAGFEVRVFYANFHLAARIGDTCYEAICFAPTSALLGERFFSRSAWGGPALGRDHAIIEAAIGEVSEKAGLSPESFCALEHQVAAWADEMAALFANAPVDVIGFSTTFEQTAASVALLNRLKDLAPEKTVLLGGANCEGEMADGILSLGSAVDYVFRGESERTFPEFLRSFRSAAQPSGRIIDGEVHRDLDSIPLTDFSEFFEQREVLLPGSAYVADDVAWLPYEASRGCWWGQKHHCTFCGINGQGMVFRERSAERVVQDLRTLVARHGLKRICMTDNIMPRDYFHSLIPVLAAEVPGLYIFYEQKANLTLDHVVALRDAGVRMIQPGIEALSSDLLRRMDKGVSARQNVALLRYARAAGVEMNWNLLYGFPGDRAEEYEATLALLPLLRHLQPPTDLCRLSIDRFSPYHDAYPRYGIRSITPMPSYAAVLPEGTDIRKVAYHFVGDYDSGVLVDERLCEQLREAVAEWRKAWDSPENAPPMLAVVALSDDQFMAMDTRGLPGSRSVVFLNARQAAAALLAHPMDRDDNYGHEARETLLAVEYEGWHVPLATAVPPVLAQFEQHGRSFVRPADPSLVQLAVAN